MEKMIAFCGLDCAKCPAYIATHSGDSELRERVAEEWTTGEYKVSPEDVNCEGCTSQGKPLFPFCRECAVRLCGLERGVENCAYCPDYPCEKLKMPWSMVPEAEDTLNKIKSKGDR